MRLETCRHDVDSCRVDAAVPSNVRQLGDVLLDPIECPRKQLPQIVRQHIARPYVRTHNPLISDQMLLRFICRPLRARQITSCPILSARAYPSSFFRASPEFGSRASCPCNSLLSFRAVPPPLRNTTAPAPVSMSRRSSAAIG